MRHHLPLLAAMLMGLSACSQSDNPIPGAKRVEMGGRSWIVRPLATKNGWQAGPDINWQERRLSNRPDINAANLHAIEHVSKCRVIAESVVHANGYSSAAVDCG
ncbi:hypothetical protein ACW9UR_14985 [Halovulum sp. GXIMD14794]